MELEGIEKRGRWRERCIFKLLPFRDEMSKRQQDERACECVCMRETVSVGMCVYMQQ